MKARKAEFKYKKEVNDVVFDIKHAKTVLFDTLAKFQKFCDDNKISFSLTFGSLLGAAREQNMIEWDDDIDLMMDYKNFHKVINLSSFLKKYGLKAYHYKDTTKCYSNEIRIYIDGNYRVQKENNGKEYLSPLCIDIFLMSKIPCDQENSLSKKDRKALKKMLLYKRLLIEKNAHFISKTKTKFYTRKVLKALLFVIPSNFLLKKIDYIVEKLYLKSDMSNDYRLYSAYALDSAFCTYDKDLMSSIELAEFGPMKTYVIKDHDSFLSNVYGDWKTPVKQSKGKENNQKFVYRSTIN